MKYLISAILLSVMMISCKKETPHCDNELSPYNYDGSCKCPEGAVMLRDDESGESPGYCEGTHMWMRYIKGSEQAESQLNDHVILVFSYYRKVPSSPYIRPTPFFNPIIYIQQIDPTTGVSEYKIANIEAQNFIEDEENEHIWTQLIDLRGAVNNSYVGMGGDFKFMTDPNIAPYGWNKRTGEGIYLKGKIDRIKREFIEWNMYFTPAGDSTTYEYTRVVPIELTPA